MAVVLIVDDEKNIRAGLSMAFQDEGYETVEAANGVEAWSLITSSFIDVVITDLKMPVMGGFELLKKITSSYPNIPVIVLTGHGTIEDAVRAMHEGAYDFFTKPIDLDHIILTCKKAISSNELREQNEKLTKELEILRHQQGYGNIIGKSAKVGSMLETIAQVAPSRASVLITGESGVGKEVVADAIQKISPRKDKPFIKVHCASLSPSLLESELFGHEKGSFTGALTQKKGRFELADTGTLFLDEIGEIDLATQVKILRVIQDKKFERVGGEKTLSVDVRIIAATNKDLLEEIKKGNFREDLYYRLNVVHITVPPLRDRKEDIELLARNFLETFSKEDNKKIDGFTAQAKKALNAYSWPGNVRELRNAIESAVVMARSTLIDTDDLPIQVSLGSENDDKLNIKVGITLKEAERELIINTIAYAKGNKTKAAEILGIGRKTLHRKLQEYGLETEND